MGKNQGFECRTEKDFQWLPVQSFKPEFSDSDFLDSFFPSIFLSDTKQHTAKQVNCERPWRHNPWRDQFSFLLRQLAKVIL